MGPCGHGVGPSPVAVPVPSVRWREVTSGRLQTVILAGPARSRRRCPCRPIGVAPRDGASSSWRETNGPTASPRWMGRGRARRALADRVRDLKGGFVVGDCTQGAGGGEGDQGESGAAKAFAGLEASKAFATLDSAAKVMAAAQARTAFSRRGRARRRSQRRRGSGGWDWQLDGGGMYRLARHDQARHSRTPGTASYMWTAFPAGCVGKGWA